MNGILVIDKPAGLTSHDVVNRVRRILKTKRVGHTGTLDPFATGVLVVLVGKATRLAQFLGKDEKAYKAVIQFGFETDTGDATGQVQNAKCKMQNEEIANVLEKTNWELVFDKFRGEIEQTPPMYSAKKVGGKKLYEHARKGVEIERKAVTVKISELEITSALSENLELETWNLELKVTCSAGTYIRTLAEDVGRAVGVGAHLTELRRTKAGRFDLSQSLTLDELDKLESPHSAILPPVIAVEHLPSIILKDDRVEKTKSGLSTRIHDTKFADNEVVRLLDEKRDLIAVGFYDAAEKSVRPKIVLV